MGVGRTIVTAIVAIAIAVLPAVGGAMAVAKAVESSLTAAADECCEHHGMPCDQSRHAMDDCGSAAACAAKCFNFVGISACEVSFVTVGAVPVAISAMPAFEPHTDPPPFPPPRV